MRRTCSRAVNTARSRSTVPSCWTMWHAPDFETPRRRLLVPGPALRVGSMITGLPDDHECAKVKADTASSTAANYRTSVRFPEGADASCRQDHHYFMRG